MYQLIIVLTRTIRLYSRGRMDVNNNLANMTLKVKCDFCEKSFFGEFLSKHMRVSHPGVERKKNWETKLQPMENEYVNQSNCRNTFSNIGSAKIPYKTQHMADKNTLKFFCKFCNKGFLLRHHRKRHKRDVHLSKKNGTSKAVEKLIWKKLKPIENGRVHCNDCNKILSCFKRARSHYKMLHMAKNDGSKFICNLCNEEFTMKYDLMNHLKEIHSRTKIPKGIIYDKLKPIEDGRIECLDCNKKFSSKETAREHYKNVHIAKNFTCVECKKGFAVEDCMKKHLKAAHMLPRRVTNRENEKYEWKIVKTNEDGRINCLDCSLTFSSLYTAKMHHKNVHMTDHNAFNCKVCLKHFKYKGSLVSHMQNMHTPDKNGNDFLCKVCYEVFPVKYALKNHIAEVHDLPEELTREKLKPIENGHVKCLDCIKTFSSKETARKHYKNWHMAKNDGSKFICNLCNEELKIKFFLVNHLQEIHGRTKITKQIICEKLKPIEDGRMKCLDCNKTFSNKESAREHYKKVHMTDQNDLKFVCKVCNKGFAVEQYMRRHMKEIHSVHYHSKCLECSKTFYCMITAKAHHKNVHMTDQNDRKFVCKVCNKGFAVEQYKRRHMKEIHMTKETFKCEVCLKHLRYKRGLVKHMNTCHGVHCRLNCLECSKTFSSLTAAKEHHKNVHRTDENDRKFICKVCNKDFSLEGNMKRHKKEVHMTKETFKCEVCLKTYKYKRNLVSHMPNCQGSKV